MLILFQHVYIIIIIKENKLYKLKKREERIILNEPKQISPFNFLLNIIIINIKEKLVLYRVNSANSSSFFFFFLSIFIFILINQNSITENKKKRENEKHKNIKKEDMKKKIYIIYCD